MICEKFFHAVNKWISTLIASATKKMMKQKDERYITPAIQCQRFHVKVVHEKCYSMVLKICWIFKLKEIDRIRKTGELLAYIRTIKMYSWELLFSGWLLDTRASEIKHLSVWHASLNCMWLR